MTAVVGRLSSQAPAVDVGELEARHEAAMSIVHGLDEHERELLFAYVVGGSPLIDEALARLRTTAGREPRGLELVAIERGRELLARRRAA